MQRIGISLFVNRNAYEGFNQIQQLDQNVLRIEIYFCNPRSLRHYQDGRPDMGQCVESVVSTKNGRNYFIDRFIKGIRVAMTLGPNSPLLANMSLYLSVKYCSNIHSPPTWQPCPHNPLRVAIGHPPIRWNSLIPDWNVDFELFDDNQGKYISIYTIRPLDHAIGLGTYYVGGVLSPNQTLFPSSQPQPHPRPQPQPRSQQPQPQERAIQGTIPPSIQLRPGPADQGTTSRSTPRLRNGIYDSHLRTYPANQDNDNDNDNDNYGGSSTVVIKRMIGDSPSSSGSS